MAETATQSDPPVRPLTAAEFDLLLLLGRPPNAPTEGLESKLDAPLDWERMQRHLWEHRIDGIALRRLRSFMEGKAPIELMEKIGRRCGQVARRNLRLTKDLIELLRLFEGKGITAMPYKGPVLMQQAYGDLGYRGMHDLDVLIDEKDLPAVKALLLHEGFELVVPKTRFGTWMERRYVRDIGFIHRERDLIVEVHWRFTNRSFYFPLDGRILLARSSTFEWAGHKFRTIPLEDEFLLLCVHGAMHTWHRLEYVAMLAGFTRSHTEIDWERTRKIAVENSQLRTFHLGLLLAHEQGGCLPSRLLAEAESDQSAVRLRRQVCGFWRQGIHEPALFNRMQFLLTLLPRRRSRIRYIFEHLLSAVLRPYLDVKKTGSEPGSRAANLVHKHSIRPADLWNLFKKAIRTS